MTLIPGALNIVDRSVENLERDISRITDRMLSGQLPLRRWSTTMAQLIKAEGIRVTELAAGGREGLTNRHFGRLGPDLRTQYTQLRKFTVSINRGELTEGQIRARARQYAGSARQIFGRQDLFSRSFQQNHNEGWRRVDPAAEHCALCPGYATGGWVPIEDIVPIGTACPCRGRCRCNVVTRFNPARGLNQASVTEQVLQTQQEAA